MNEGPFHSPARGNSKEARCTRKGVRALRALFPFLLPPKHMWPKKRDEIIVGLVKCFFRRRQHDDTRGTMKRKGHLKRKNVHLQHNNQTFIDIYGVYQVRYRLDWKRNSRFLVVKHKQVDARKKHILSCLLFSSLKDSVTSKQVLSHPNLLLIMVGCCVKESQK